MFISGRGFECGTRGVLVGVLWLALVTVGAAQEDDGMWHYQIKPGDDLWKIAQTYLADPGYWHELVRLNKIDNPRRLRPGRVIKIPLYWLKLQRAGVKIVNLRGTVTHLPARGEPRPLTADTELHIDDGVLVGDDASLLLEFADGSRALLGPGSRAFFRRLNRIAGSEYGDTRLEVTQGSLETQVPVHGTRFQIDTPAANTTVRGTQFAVGVDRKGEKPLARVEVARGKVGVANQVGAQNVPGGFGTLATPDEPPKPPVRLLPPPVLKPPAGPVRKLPVTLRWQPVPGAIGYRVTLFPDRPNAVPLVVTEVERNGYSHPDLDDGSWRVRVQALDRQRLAGEGAEMKLVVDARPFPPMPTSPAPGAVLRGERVELRWSQPPQADAYRLQLSSSEDFARPLLDETTNATRLEVKPLKPGLWYWRLATRVADEQGPWSLVRRFELRPEPPVPTPQAKSEGDRLQLAWEKGAPGQKYQVQLARDPAFQDLLLDRLLEEPRLSLKQPEEAVHFRVRVVDADGYQGAWSPVQTIHPPPEPWYLFGVPAALILLLAL